MRTAVVVTGFLRDNETADQIFPQFYGQPDTDFYLTCWDLRSTKAPGGLSKDIPLLVTEDDVRQRYPVHSDIQIVDHAGYEANRPYTVSIIDRPDDVTVTSRRAKVHYGVGYAQRITDMFYLNKLAMDRVPLDKYDRVIKLRHDMKITKPFPIGEEVDTVLNIDNHQQVLDIHKQRAPLQYSNLIGLTHLDLKPYAMSYQVAWSNPEYMRQYSETYDQLKIMYERDNVDLSAYEHVMAYSIQRMSKLPFLIHNIEKFYHFVR